MRSEISPELFERLFNEKYMPLYFFAYDYLGDEEVCKDIVSDAFAELWHRRNGLSETNFSAYLYACVKNSCLDCLRREQVRNRYDEEQLALFDESEEEGGYEEREERIQMMRRELMRLPPRVVRILKARFFDNLSNKEVAEQLGLTVEGVKKTIVRAFAEIRARHQKEVKK